MGAVWAAAGRCGCASNRIGRTRSDRLILLGFRCIERKLTVKEHTTNDGWGTGPGNPDCQHEKHMPSYSDDDIRGDLDANMPSINIRTKYPRYFGKCADCGSLVILYSSALHYIAGGW